MDRHATYEEKVMCGCNKWDDAVIAFEDVEIKCRLLFWKTTMTALFAVKRK
jgi:hypothetical protein